MADQRITVMATGECECGTGMVLTFVADLRQVRDGWVVLVPAGQSAGCEKCGKFYRPDSPEINWPVRVTLFRRDITAVVKFL